LKIEDCRLLIISGPTATGKTNLAIKLAKLYNGELISADSRQLYQGLDIGTGKDHPKDTNIHLIDIITPDKSFSVAQYQKFAFQKIDEIHQENKLPIIVGGTGQYIDAIVNPDKATYSIKPNPFLRFFLNKFPVSTLQKIYCLLDKKSFLSLNKLSMDQTINNSFLVDKNFNIILQGDPIVNMTIQQEYVSTISVFKEKKQQ